MWERLDVRLGLFARWVYYVEKRRNSLGSLELPSILMKVGLLLNAG